MKILHLTKKFPFPLKDGESVAVNSLSRALAKQGCEVHLLSMNTTKHHVEVAQIRSHIDQYSSVTTSPVDNKLKVLDAAANLFSNKSYHITRFDYKDFRDRLSELLQDTPFDIVLMESIYLTPYIDDIRAVANIPIVMRAHNVEHEIWERVANQTLSFWKRSYLQLLVQRLRAYELAQLSKIDGLITFTKRDLHFFKQQGYGKSSLIAPIGVETSKYSAKENDSSMSVGFIGSLDWTPNIEGLQWFVKQVWPLVVKGNAAAKLYIAGRNPSKSVSAMASKSVTVLGEVADAKAFVAKHPISIVPLLSGGGMRVKILEAMALSRAIVSTSVGTEGIKSDGILVADEPQAFAAAILNLIANPELINKLGAAGRTDVAAHYDSVANGTAVFDFLQKLTSSIL